MTMPETIWAWDECHHTETNPHNVHATEYVLRSSVQGMIDEKVRDERTAFVQRLNVLKMFVTLGVQQFTEKPEMTPAELDNVKYSAREVLHEIERCIAKIAGAE